MKTYLWFLPFVALAVLTASCAIGGGEKLEIDARRVLGVHDMRQELSAMLADLGYQWIPLLDRDTEQPAKIVKQSGDYRMRFEYVTTKQVRIDARINPTDNYTWLHFYEPDSQTLSASSAALFEALKDRAVLEFGRENVSY